MSVQTADATLREYASKLGSWYVNNVPLRATLSLGGLAALYFAKDFAGKRWPYVVGGLIAIGVSTGPTIVKWIQDVKEEVL